MMRDEFEAWSLRQLREVEAALERWVPEAAPAGLGAAMRYGVLDGGKRLRPLLVLAAAEAVGASRIDTSYGRRAAIESAGQAASQAPRRAGDAATLDGEAAMRAACAVELIHAYSLIHDDMPCMDNDVLRRGKPTVHVRFGQAQAMLAGDAMQALAFEVLTPETGTVAPALQARLCGLLARAAGQDGMAGGQAIDLASVGCALDETTLSDMHRRKTGALLQTSVLMGAACGSFAARGDPDRAGSEAAACDARVQEALREYGAAIGLAFQVVDDILDATQASGTLGKTAGKDADSNKPTYVSVLGLQAAQRRAESLRDQAQAALHRSGLQDAAWLSVLADKVVQRDS